jgi:hypothetical protein
MGRRRGRGRGKKGKEGSRFTIISCYFVATTRHSIQAICQAFVLKVFSRYFDDLPVDISLPNDDL